MNSDVLEKKIAEFEELQPWNHNFTLGDGVQTRPGKQVSHGKNLIKLERLKPIFNLIGLENKSVLDVGCNEGFFSLYMGGENAEVLGVDVDEHRIAKAKFVESVQKAGNVDFKLMDIYSEEFKALPTFDLCLSLGFIHRVPDPYAAIAALASKSNMIVFEWKALKFGMHDEAIAYFSPKQIDEKDYFGTEYWLLSYAAVERILRRLGMNYFHRVDDPRQRRAVLVAGRVDHPIFHEPDRVYRGGRIMTLARHGKRFLRTVFGIVTGRINA